MLPEEFEWVFLEGAMWLATGKWTTDANSREWAINYCRWCILMLPGKSSLADSLPALWWSDDNDRNLCLKALASLVELGLVTAPSGIAGECGPIIAPVEHVPTDTILGESPIDTLFAWLHERSAHLSCPGDPNRGPRPVHEPVDFELTTDAWGS